MASLGSQPVNAPATSTDTRWAANAPRGDTASGLASGSGRIPLPGLYPLRPRVRPPYIGKTAQICGKLNGRQPGLLVYHGVQALAGDNLVREG